MSRSFGRSRIRGVIISDSNVAYGGEVVRSLLSLSHVFRFNLGQPQGVGDLLASELTRKPLEVVRLFQFLVSELTRELLVTAGGVNCQIYVVLLNGHLTLFWACILQNWLCLQSPHGHHWDLTGVLRVVVLHVLIHSSLRLSDL